MGNSQALKNLYLFKDLSNSEIEVVAKAAEVIHFQTGDEVFSKGDSARALFVVQRGSVRISLTAEAGDMVEVARLGTGSHFGEMAFLDGEPRSATATALEPTEIISIDYDKLSEIMVENTGIAVHFYRQFANFLCGRLRLTTKDLSFARSKVLSHF